MSQLQEITATFTQERHRFANADGDVVIAECYCNSDINGPITIKGQADYDELKPQQTYRFYGRWTSYKNKRTGVNEQQFAFQSFVLQAPHSRQGVVAYLRNAGDGLGFGNARAAKCWELYGSDAVKMLREQPAEVAAALCRHSLKLTEDKAAKIAAVLAEDSALEGCTLDLMDLLTGRGFPKSTSRLAVRYWGNRAAQIIRRNPYLLMKRFPGCGFKKCDALYLDLKLPPGRLKRQALCAWYEIATATGQHGHTWWPVKTATDGIKANISAAEIQPGRAIELAVRSGWLNEIRTSGVSGPVVSIRDADGSTRWLAEGAKAKNEADLAEIVADALKEPNTWPDIGQVEGISDHQREQLAKALQGQIAILGGSPGTGKTYVAAALIRTLVGIFGSESIGVGAPTGKAAVRVTESLAGYGLSLRARTWHSMLALSDRYGEHFPYKVLIGDESSMVDTDLAAMVFRRRAVGTLVLLVGDICQLPPVGHGAPLRDLIAAGLPYGELREIMRNSGGIVEACAAIRDGQRWEPGDNLRLIQTGQPELQIAEMLKAIKLAAADGFNPIWDCQVVVPVNKKSPLSRKELNKVLQAELNSRPGINGSPFRLGDKVVNTKNAFFPSVDADLGDDDTQVNERGEVYVANGELGEVIDVQEKLTVIKLSNPARTIKVPRGKADESAGGDEKPSEDGESESTGTGCSWDLGYALSVHKSQGSEWPVVIVMIDEYPGARMVCDRSWIYTAISRAKKQCVMVGRRETVDVMCRKFNLSKRKTFLKERILLASASLALADL